MSAAESKVVAVASGSTEVTVIVAAAKPAMEPPECVPPASTKVLGLVSVRTGASLTLLTAIVFVVS